MKCYDKTICTFYIYDKLNVNAMYSVSEKGVKKKTTKTLNSVSLRYIKKLHNIKHKIYMDELQNHFDV